MRARPTWRTRHRGSGTWTARASAASILARSGRMMIAALCLALLALASPAGAAAAPQPEPSPQPAPSGSPSTPSPDPVPGAASSAAANSAVSTASTSHAVVTTNSAPAEQPVQTAPAGQPPKAAPTVSPSSGGHGVSLAEPTITRPSSPARRHSESTASNVPVVSVPVERATRATSKHPHTARRNAVSATTTARPNTFWRHLHAVWTLPATLSAMLPLPHRSGLLLLLGAVALFVLVGASVSSMRMLLRTGAERGRP
jgi:hypothetical protein